jgi:Fe2+ transport system protein FeoA
MRPQKISNSQETNDTLRALRRAARSALRLGIQTGTPVYVIKDGQIVDLTKQTSRAQKLAVKKGRAKKRLGSKRSGTK